METETFCILTIPEYPGICSTIVMQDARCYEGNE